MEDLPSLYFMLFDRYGIHIQAFANVFMENVSSSDPHLHKINLKIYTHFSQQKRKKQKRKRDKNNIVPRAYIFRKCSKICRVQIDKNNICQDDSIFVLYFLSHFGNS